MNSKQKNSINGGLSAAFYTLGCRVNQYETDAIEEQFINAGFEIKNFNEPCDVYVINTCTVTAESDRKSRQIIRRTAHVKKPGAVVIVCGCYSQGKPGEVFELDEVDIVLGNMGKSDIVGIAQKALVNKQKQCLVKDISEVTIYEDCEISKSERTRAFVKIVDGCENKCTYCIIPTVRGKIRSRSEKSILDEVTRLADSGYKEVVLTGIETAAYGKERGRSEKSPLVELIKNVSEIEGIERIRLGSMEPTIFTEDFVKEISQIKKLMPHYHLSLQSGSDAILNLMKRKYNREQFLTVINRLRTYIPEIQITTDIIVGFPGETEKHFEETLKYLDICRFSFVHIFPYSKREGTPASTMSKQVTRVIKRSRVTELDKIMRNIRKEILTEFVGTETSVLIETPDGTKLNGYTPSYIKVIIDKNDTLEINTGEIISVKIIGITADLDSTLCLVGEPI